MDIHTVTPPMSSPTASRTTRLTDAITHDSEEIGARAACHRTGTAASCATSEKTHTDVVDQRYKPPITAVPANQAMP